MYTPLGSEPSSSNSELRGGSGGSFRDAGGYGLRNNVASFAERDRKLEEARQQRRVRRSQADRPDALATEPSVNHGEVQIIAS
jgi:hypothetical protein